MLPSLTIRSSPISAVADTWVPPHSSARSSPNDTTRTSSPYLSPKNAMAPPLTASAYGRTCVLRSGWPAPAR